MRVARAVSNLIEAFERLPGIGPKSAARLTYYLLHVPQAELDRFAGSLSSLKKDTKQCHNCFNIAETDPCDICGDLVRDASIVCVVEQPLDVMALENGGKYRGLYHVLGGVIDPLHNIGPEEIKIGELLSRIQDSGSRIQEIILALNPNMEGEATCLYIRQQFQILNFKFKITRIAHGLPIGADIQYADDQTLNHALAGRREY